MTYADMRGTLLWLPAASPSLVGLRPFRVAHTSLRTASLGCALPLSHPSLKLYWRAVWSVQAANCDQLYASQRPLGPSSSGFSLWPRLVLARGERASGFHGLIVLALTPECTAVPSIVYTFYRSTTSVLVV